VILESVLNNITIAGDDIEQRIIMRIVYQQAKKQSNTELVVQYAADQLKTSKK